MPYQIDCDGYNAILKPSTAGIKTGEKTLWSVNLLQQAFDGRSNLLSSTALHVWAKQSGQGYAFFRPGVFLSDSDVVAPDVVWLTKENLALSEDESGHLTSVPELVVEVLSPSKEDIRRDCLAKLKLYSVQGAQEYWIADRFSKRLEVYRRQDARLTLFATLDGTDTLRSPLLPGFSYQVSQFFD